MLGPSGPLCAEGCISCAQFVADGLRSGDLVRRGAMVANEFPGGVDLFDPVTCLTVWPDGSLRNRRLLKDGTVCEQGCSKVAPTPCPPPSAPPSSPVPLPSTAPPLTESGNLPIDYLTALCATGFSPTHEVGISVLSQRECAGEPGCRVVNLHATEKSVKPYCEHSCYDEQGRYALSNCRLRCETLRECQQPEFVNTTHAGVRMEIAHPDWQNEWGVCDKRTADCPFEDCRRNFICHDRVVNRTGTRARACMPDGTRCGPEARY